MPQVINLVCTRCIDGNHTDLQSWYNDHAQLLMASNALQSAELYRLQQTTAAIDYFCMYHFNQLEEFRAFDAGDVMAQVRDLSHAAPGRSSIEIVKRTQYERLLHRCWGTEQAGFLQAGLYTLETELAQQAMRWLNDALYALHGKHPLQSAQVYAKVADSKTELFVLLQAASSAPLPLDWHVWQSQYAPPQDMQSIWQAQAERIAQWLR